MEKVYDICCGVDVHKKLIIACLRSGRKNEIRQFGATTRELLEMAAWLDEAKCEMTAMESTASYWKPLYNVLETWGLPVMVVNAHHMKAAPGRKTDVQDAEWIADLLQHGLLKASYTTFLLCLQFLTNLLSFPHGILTNAHFLSTVVGCKFRSASTTCTEI